MQITQMTRCEQVVKNNRENFLCVCVEAVCQRLRPIVDLMTAWI